jgi:dTDP-4-amino-4,6-dideoxygalactose transaminase
VKRLTMMHKVALLRKSRKQRQIEIPLLDLTRKYRAIEDKLLQQWRTVFSSMKLFNGPNLAAFEKEFAAYCGVEHALGVASGTDAIYLSLQALDLSPGEEVVLPAHAPAPVVEPILAIGAVPVLVDKAKGDYGPDLQSLRSAITTKTKAIIAVHLLGLPCDMDPILKIAREKNLLVIEDASQAQGAIYKGRRAAGWGAITPMSLGTVKNLACYGDGGVVLTNDGSLAERIRLLRVHGQAEKYDHRIYGWNSRLDEIQAAALRVKLPTLDQDNNRRRQIAAQYSNYFRSLPLKTPPTFPDRLSVYHQYVVETPLRDTLKQFLTHRGIGTGIYYPIPLHRHGAWKTKGLTRYFLPEAERFASENLALPVFPELSDEEMSYIISAVDEFFSMMD